MTTGKGSNKSSNVVQVPPRRKRVWHKGLFGWLEYLPSIKAWRWIFKAQFTVTNSGQEKTEAQAEYELKKFMDAASISKNIQSVD